MKGNVINFAERVARRKLIETKITSEAEASDTEFGLPVADLVRTAIYYLHRYHNVYIAMLCLGSILQTDMADEVIGTCKRVHGACLEMDDDYMSEVFLTTTVTDDIRD